jgi:hypothetical protein
LGEYFSIAAVLSSVRAELVEACTKQMNSIEFLTQAMAGKLPEWISAIAAFLSMCGVLLVWKQLILTKSIAQLQFEDTLEKELVSNIPTKALLDSDLTEEEYRQNFDELFRYFDLSNRQVSLRKDGRISEATWVNWLVGIRFNMSLPAFAKAWGEIKSRTEEHAGDFFSELRMLDALKFDSDPKSWSATQLR